MRERELVRIRALGAVRGRLIRQFLTEAFVLSFIAGAPWEYWGIFFVWQGSFLLAPQSLPRLDSVSVSLPVLAFALFALRIAVAVDWERSPLYERHPATCVYVPTRGGRGQAALSRQPTHRPGNCLRPGSPSPPLVSGGGSGIARPQSDEGLEVNPGFRVDKIVIMDVSLPWVKQTGPTRKRRQLRGGSIRT